jgi:hypothetical protein
MTTPRVALLAYGASSLMSVFFCFAKSHGALTGAVDAAAQGGLAQAGQAAR